MHYNIKSILKFDKADDKQVVVKGWLKTARHSKKFSFLEVSDGTSFHGIQVVVDSDLENYENEVRKLNTGCSVIIEGKLVESPGKGQKFEIQAKKVDVVGFTEDDYPLQKKDIHLNF